MKSYTNIEQSKILAEILPLGSADMCYIQDYLAGGKYGEYKPYIGNLIPAYGQGKIRCWSLAALLNNIPQAKLDNIKQYNKKHWRCCAYFASDWHNSDWHDNPVDACYEMVLKLHEQKLL